MRRGDRLEPGDRASRYCSPKHVTDGRVLATAFRLRAGEDHLSVNWLEYFRTRSKSRRQQIAHVREAFRTKGYEVKRGGRFAVLDVGRAIRAVSAHAQKQIEFLYWPEGEDLSHSGVFGYSQIDVTAVAALQSVVSPADIFAVPHPD